MPTGLICSYCNDAADVVTPHNGSNLLRTSHGEIIVALHTRCEEKWADKNNCRALVPLRKMRPSYRSNVISSDTVH